MKRNYVKRYIRICIYIGICLLLPIFLNIHKNCPNVVWAKENAEHETHNVYEEDNRLEPSTHETYDYEQNPAKNYIYNRHTWVAKRYSEELFFDRGYQAEYDGEKLMAELQYQDYWGSNKYGVWEYRIYQYNDNKDCILKAAVTEDNITLSCYEYDDKARKVDEYTYLVKEDWELKCDNGSVIYFSAIKGPAVKKVSADGAVEKELYYGRAADMGQQHYLMPEDVEDTIDDHKYTVKPGDCLWNIAYNYYGHGTYYNILHRANLGVIGPDENLIEPGMRLFIPEAGNAQDTIIR